MSASSPSHTPSQLRDLARVLLQTRSGEGSRKEFATALATWLKPETQAAVIALVDRLERTANRLEAHWGEDDALSVMATPLLPESNDE